MYISDVEGLAGKSIATSFTFRLRACVCAKLRTWDDSAVARGRRIICGDRFVHPSFRPPSGSIGTAANVCFLTIPNDVDVYGAAEYM